jgi:hypothetical protein
VGLPNLTPAVVPPESTLNVLEFPFPEAVVMTVGVPLITEVSRPFPDESIHFFEPRCNPPLEIAYMEKI